MTTARVTGDGIGRPQGQRARVTVEGDGRGRGATGDELGRWAMGKGKGNSKDAMEKGSVAVNY